MRKGVSLLSFLIMILILINLKSIAGSNGNKNKASHSSQIIEECIEDSLAIKPYKLDSLPTEQWANKIEGLMEKIVLDFNSKPIHLKNNACNNL